MMALKTVFLMMVLTVILVGGAAAYPRFNFRLKETL